MPTYVFDREAFLKFVEKNLGEDAVVVVSSDVTDVEVARGDSYGLGERDFYMVTVGVADVFEGGEGEFDEIPKYLVVFADGKRVREDARRAARKK